MARNFRLDKSLLGALNFYGFQFKNKASDSSNGNGDGNKQTQNDPESNGLYQTHDKDMRVNVMNSATGIIVTAAVTNLPFPVQSLSCHSNHWVVPEKRMHFHLYAPFLK